MENNVNLAPSPPGYIQASGIYYEGSLRTIKKLLPQLRPIFEAFINAFEAINPQNKSESGTGNQSVIDMELNLKKNLLGNDRTFQKFIVRDTGIGFTEDNFNRIQHLHDSRKMKRNKGIGRVQYLHYFKETKITSIYRDNNSKTGHYQRVFTLSKQPDYIRKNAIIYYQEFKAVETSPPFTEIIFSDPWNEKDASFYSKLSLEQLKEQLIMHYLAYLCSNREYIPEIKLGLKVDDELENSLSIDKSDIPNIDKKEKLVVRTSKINPEKKDVEHTSNQKDFTLTAFKINKIKLEENGLKLVSRGEILKDIDLQCLKPDEDIDEMRYLFLVSGQYIDDQDKDESGEVHWHTTKELKQRAKDVQKYLYNEEYVLIDRIVEEVNEKIQKIYKEIKRKQNEQDERINELKKMFLLSEESITKTRISINDTVQQILEKVYKTDTQKIAKLDAELRDQIQAITSLNPSSGNYVSMLENKTEKIVEKLPLQNRTVLAGYVARRKIILELFDKILKQELNIQRTSKRNINEKLLHNLVFQQSADEPDKSDLWLISEDFIYFKGTSDIKLNSIKINGETIIKDNLSEEEKTFIESLGKKRLQKKPDILLFPSEAKCIIIEFKNPDTNVGDYLSQITYYATLIYNFSKREFNTFYGYLIGEKIDPDDIKSHDANFQEAYHLDYLFRPHERVYGKFRTPDASLYTEVIKYSTLLERAKRRNQMFIEKLGLQT